MYTLQIAHCKNKYQIAIQVIKSNAKGGFTDGEDKGWVSLL